MRTFDTFIFDLDGTLLDTLPDLVVNTNTALEQEGYPQRTGEEIHSFVGGGLHSLIEHCLPEGSSEEQIQQVMTRWKELYETIGTALTDVFPGIEETLDELHKEHARLGVLSNKFDQGVKGLIAERFPDMFSSVHGESSTIPRKPDPTGLLFVIEELKSIPDSSVYIGDSPTDILVSKRAGVFSVGVSWGYHDKDALEKAEADLVIETPQELLQLINS